jgi:uncharacterized membrane protein YdjX (TVP38/TMEM64 family)
MSVPSERTGPRALKRVVGGVLVVAAVAAVMSGAFAELSVARLRQTIGEAGPWGPAIYVAIFGLLQPFGLTAHVLVPAAGLIWEPKLAVALAWTGSMASTTTAFWFARYVGQDWVQARLPARLRGYDDRLERHGFRTVLVLRLVFYTLAPVQHMFGVSRARFRDVLAGTAIGVVPVLLVEVLIGVGVLTWLTG